MIHVINRATGVVEEEQVWGGGALRFLYRTWFGQLFRFVASHPLCTKVWGYLHDRPSSKKSVAAFCQRYSINSDEFTKPITAYTSFNDFFVRHLKPASRPISASPAILPADARYLFFDNISENDFLVKGQRFNLHTFLLTESDRYIGGTGILARLCPIDCHRFVFPISGIATDSQRISGSYLSVNPIATHTLPEIFWTNVREVTFIESDQFGTVAMVEIGATNCASIVQTYTPGRIEKGQEKGYFRLGGSAIMLLFEKGRLNLSQDIQKLAKSGFEIYALYGQELGLRKL